MKPHVISHSRFGCTLTLCLVSCLSNKRLITHPFISSNIQHEQHIIKKQYVVYILSAAVPFKNEMVDLLQSEKGFIFHAWKEKNKVSYITNMILTMFLYIHELLCFPYNKCSYQISYMKMEWKKNEVMTFYCLQNHFLWGKFWDENLIFQLKWKNKKTS